MHQGLGVATGVEMVTAALEIFAELVVVINLAVEHRPHRLILVVDRLTAYCHVDDRQAPHSEPDLVAYEIPLVIWSAVPEGVVHRPDDRVVDRVAGRAEDPDDSAHQEFSWSSAVGIGIRIAPHEVPGFEADVFIDPLVPVVERDIQGARRPNEGVPPKAAADLGEGRTAEDDVGDLTPAQGNRR